MSAACPVYGFEVVFHLAPASSGAAGAALWDRFISGPIGGRGLVCVGGITAGSRWSHVVHGEAGQATDADRQAVIAWAESRPEIVAADVGPLTDVTSLV